MQPSRNQIITELYSSPDIAAAIGKMQPAELQGDLRQEMFAALCAADEGELLGMWERGELKYWLARVMLNMGTSNRSTFYRQYRKFAEEILDAGLTILPAGEIARPAGSTRDMEIEPTSVAVYGRQTPEGLMHHDEQPAQWSEQVGAALAQLDFYEREIFRLYAEQGYNCRVVAEATGISERNVRFAVASARKKLKQTLKSYD